MPSHIPGEKSGFLMQQIFEQITAKHLSAFSGGSHDLESPGKKVSVIYFLDP